MGNDRIVQVNGVELCVETIGEPGDPAILLISGAGASMDWWEDDFCAQVESLTLISTSPGGPGGPNNPDLPAMSEQLQAYFAGPASTPDWTDRSAVVDYIVEDERQFAGSLRFDESHVREIAGRVFDRTNDMAASMTNPWLIEAGDSVRPRLGQVSASTLVIHGTADPLFPYGHAEALANEIPDSRLLPLDGVGHQMPPAAVWDVVVPAIRRRHVGSPAPGSGRSSSGAAWAPTPNTLRSSASTPLPSTSLKRPSDSPASASPSQRWTTSCETSSIRPPSGSAHLTSWRRSSRPSFAGPSTRAGHRQRRPHGRARRNTPGDRGHPPRRWGAHRHPAMATHARRSPSLCNRRPHDGTD
jgi:pimeloyl-ACP methyl ester carboxylesterase